MTQTDRETTINQRRARIAAGKIGDANIAADLVQYGHGRGDGLHIALAQLLWPAAFSFFDALHHGRDVDGLPFPIDVYKLAREGDSTAVATWATAELAKRQGMGWGHYPIVKGGENATGSKLTWKVKEGDSVAKRSIIPTCPAHNSLIRICNQILAEAESTILRVLTMTSGEAKKAKERWKKRPSVRYLGIPQHGGHVVMVHSEAADGGNELSAMCEGYGKAELYALVGKWIANKSARIQPCNGWGKRYKLAKGHNEESLAEQEKQGAAVASGKAGQFSLTALHSPYTVASALNSTVDGAGHGLDVTTSIKGDVETLLELELIQPLKAKSMASLQRAEQVLQGNQNAEIPYLGIYKENNTMCLSRENEGAADASPLSAKPPKQRNKPQKSLVEGAAELLERTIAEFLSTAVASEVQPC